MLQMIMSDFVLLGRDIASLGRSFPTFLRVKGQ
jgi:hypothetical protein